MDPIPMAKILLRHPDKNVRALEPKALEFYNKQSEETDTYMPERVEENVVYELPQKYAKRLLAGQPERYFLIEPAFLIVKRHDGGGLTHKHVRVEANPAMISKFFKQDDAAAQETYEKNQALARQKADTDAKAKAKEIADAEAKKKAEADAETLVALENAPLSDAPNGRPPEL